MDKPPETLERQLLHAFTDKSLLRQAVTHRSHSGPNNERLEFLGDGILNFIIADELYERFPTASEGQLSRLRAGMVRGSTLAEVAREMTLGDHLIMGTGELRSGGFARDSILSDALEALIGAMYVDAGFEVTRRQVRLWFDERLSALSLAQMKKDAKSRLQEYLQSVGQPLPEYSVTEVQGQAHDLTFQVQCRIALLPEPGWGEGSSRRIAEQNAASALLARLGGSNDSD